MGYHDGYARLRFKSHLWVHTKGCELVFDQSNEGNLLYGVEKPSVGPYPVL